MIATLLIVHALVAIIAFGLLPFPSLLAKPMIASANAGTIRAVFSVLVMRAKLAGPLAMLAALLGLWLVHAMNLSYTAGWLVASYIAFVVLIALGIGVHARWEQRVLVAAQGASQGTITQELTGILSDRTNASLYAVSMLCWLALFYFMIVRPF